LKWEQKKATAMLRSAESHLASGRTESGLGLLCRAFDMLDRDGLEDGDLDELRSEIGEKLYEAARGSGHIIPLAQRASRLLARVPARNGLVDRIARYLAVEKRRPDPECLEFYIAYLETQRPGDRELRVRLKQILARALHIRMTSDVAEVRPRVPLLERLHTFDPRMNFPRLFLGRFHYLENRFLEASRLLAGVTGRIAHEPKLLNARARCAEKLGRIDEAQELYARSLACNDRQPQVHFRAGRIFLEQYLESLSARLPLAGVHGRSATLALDPDAPADAASASSTGL
jgi:tetratricopeptide (TPR) repeat protein